jgi:hypothetical protein
MLEAEMVSADDEVRRPEVGSLVAHSLDQLDELAFIGSKLGVLWRDLATEERNWPGILVKNGAESRAGCVTIDDEAFNKVG